MIFFYFNIKSKKVSLSGKNSLITMEKADKLPENPDNFKNFQKSVIFTCFLFGIGIYWKRTAKENNLNS